MSGENVSSVGQSLNGQQRPLRNNMSGEKVSSVRESLIQLGQVPLCLPLQITSWLRNGAPNGRIRMRFQCIG